MAIAQIPLEHSLLLAAILFALGLVGVLTRRNLIYVLICIEIMFNAAGFAFIAAGTRWGAPDGQVMFILILAVAAANVSIGLALVLQVFRQVRGIDADALREMRG